MADKLSMHCYVTGKVQGVWFRANTQEQAKSLGLTGYAKNLPDGRVEVLASGEKAKLDKLHEWLKHGPELARVTDLTREDLPWQEHHDFTCR